MGRHHIVPHGGADRDLLSLNKPFVRLKIQGGFIFPNEIHPQEQWVNQVFDYLEFHMHCCGTKFYWQKNRTLSPHW